ncbi:unnamed protein product [Tuber melanosporum]|jgi:protein OS-9|uniref:Endoplasmic reticulum lectin n=1 Tax=Tuber melanosporum (strain Mel28) TaxID=656061 RepID=D5G5U0_TUBMM|nr:uncharacterized protein GSTUM_00001576001 [Tuber melanosporum]KAG0131002.1 glucosidase II beta subunit-like protein-domain-containing protein [Tuber indicum]CAZ79883.1 unnamed protein product [Tuber melanosporum]
MARLGILILLMGEIVARSGVHGMFSVHDDLLAFPQYEIKFYDDVILEEEAEERLSSAPTISSNPQPRATGTVREDAGPDAARDGEGEGEGTHEVETYEALWLNGRRYLCSVPIVTPAPPMNATEKELSKAAEEKELVRATTRGWELLSDLEGHCLYFVSGWWSYSYCHNHEIRQFHQKPPQNGVNTWPPAEDPATPSYVLGQVSPEAAKRTKGQKGEGTELQATGELRFLVQKLGGGTTCDLTGKERKIEVQFHCNSQGSDRIGWIKEVSICCYLMVVYTPRLCNDVAFLPPREDRANSISCREIMTPGQIEKYHTDKAKVGEDKATKVPKKAQELGAGDEAKKAEIRTLGGVVLRGANDPFTDGDVEIIIRHEL